LQANEATATIVDAMIRSLGIAHFGIYAQLGPSKSARYGDSYADKLTVSIVPGHGW